MLRCVTINRQQQQQNDRFADTAFILQGKQDLGQLEVE